MTKNKRAKTDFPAQLHQLLGRNLDNPLAPLCLAAVKRRYMKVSNTGARPIAQIRKIYTERSEINQSLNDSRVVGIEATLAALNNSDKEEVIIYSIRATMEKFLVITDIDRQTLLGVIHILQGQDKPFEYDLAWP